MAQVAVAPQAVRTLFADGVDVDARLNDVQYRVRLAHRGMGGVYGPGQVDDAFVDGSADAGHAVFLVGEQLHVLYLPRRALPDAPIGTPLGQTVRVALDTILMLP